MGLERVHRRTNNVERFGPVRLGAQDLRDLAAVFAELDSRVHLSLPDLSRTEFNIGEHETEDIEDVLAFADADTLPAIHILSAELRLSFHASPGQTSIARPFAPRHVDDQQAIDEAAHKLRQIIQSRQLRPVDVLRQRGPGKWLLATLFTVPALALAAGQSLLDVWLTHTASQAVIAAVVWLCVVLLLILSGRSKDLIRLRGRELPWWERRQGLLALLGLVLAVVIPFAIFGLERVQG